MTPDEVFAKVASKHPRPNWDQSPVMFKFSIGSLIGTLVKEGEITVDESREALDVIIPLATNEDVVTRIWG